MALCNLCAYCGGSLPCACNMTWAPANGSPAYDPAMVFEPGQDFTIGFFDDRGHRIMGDLPKAPTKTDADYVEEAERELRQLAGIEPAANPRHWKLIERAKSYEETQKESRARLAALMGEHGTEHGINEALVIPLMDPRD